MPRSAKLDKKTAVSVKLPPCLIEWMDRQPESRAVLIEAALANYYKIQECIKPATPPKELGGVKPRWNYPKK